MNVFNIPAIVKRNNETFYDFESHKTVSQKPKVLTLNILSIMLAILCPKVSDSLLAGFLAAQSILLGFGFNLMLFLAGHSENEAGTPESIEAQLRHERTTVLYHELFHNVSYFNLIAVASIIIATVLLLPTMEIPSFLRDFGIFNSYLHWLSISKTPALAQLIFHYALMYVFYRLSCEALYSITRVIGRVSFYFERKIGATSPPDQ